MLASHAFGPDLLREALASGTIVLAPNERAARDLRTHFDQAQLAAGSAAWEPAQIYSWNAWLEFTWSSLVTEGADLRLLLNPAQELMLWREVIAAAPADANASSLASLDSLAQMAQNAFRLAASYEATTANLRPSANTHDSRTFADWATAFHKRCEQRQYLSVAQLPRILREHIDRGTLPIPPRLLLASFDDDTPARASLLTALTMHGCHIQRLAITAEPGSNTLRAVVRAATLHEETLTAARYIRQFLETFKPNLNPSQTTSLELKTEQNPSFTHSNEAPSTLKPSNLTPQQAPRIALIVPKLSEERPALEAVLRNILAPELNSIAADLSSTPFAFATGAPLASAAMVATALDLIRWVAEPLPIDRITALLLSPYIGSAAEVPERAAFDAFKLRKTPTLLLEFELPRVLPLATKFASVRNLLTPLAAHAHRLATDARRQHATSYADWMELIRDILRDAHWPGDRPLTAHEFHDARSWEHALDTVASLDFAGTRVDFPTALQALERQARAASSAHGTADAILQVMTPADAAGSTFDAVLFLRATDANWPSSERANPLLGWTLQHDLKMPGTDPAQTSVRAEQTTARLSAAAPNVLFFYAEDQNAQSGPQRLSPTIERLGWSTLSPTTLLLPFEPAFQIPLDELEDEAPLPPLLSPIVRGGAMVLKLQAACGFRAFAEMRLFANAPEDVLNGLNARESGNFVHEIMDLFWREVQTQDALRALPRAARIAKLQSAIDTSFGLRASSDALWSDAYVVLQKERMQSVLIQWLDRELLRNPFTVTEREEKKQIEVGPLTFQLRMDRIDTVEGGTVLVDYKTGASSNPRDWEGDRPDDPQLPLYAVMANHNTLQGIAFAKILPGKDMKWLGYSEGQHIPKSLPMEYATIPDQIEAWRIVLTQLANDFNEGKADVSPKEYPFTCIHCTQRLLCRLDPATLNADADADTADPNEPADVE